MGSKKRGREQLNQKPSRSQSTEAFAILTMAAQITPNNEVPSLSSPKVAQIHTSRPSIDEHAEDRDIGQEEVWSDDEAEEEGPKRKRPRPLSAS
jgi:hypothetical protein